MRRVTQVFLKDSALAGPATRAHTVPLVKRNGAETIPGDIPESSFIEPLNIGTQGLVDQYRTLSFIIEFLCFAYAVGNKGLRIGIYP